jgi:hypothetical protein
MSFVRGIKGNSGINRSTTIAWPAAADTTVGAGPSPWPNHQIMAQFAMPLSACSILAQGAGSPADLAHLPGEIFSKFRISFIPLNISRIWPKLPQFIINSTNLIKMQTQFPLNPCEEIYAMDLTNLSVSPHHLVQNFMTPKLVEINYKYPWMFKPWGMHLNSLSSSLYKIPHHFSLPRIAAII